MGCATGGMAEGAPIVRLGWQQPDREGCNAPGYGLTADKGARALPFRPASLLLLVDGLR